MLGVELSAFWSGCQWQLRCLASCLLVVLAHSHASGHLRLVYESVQRCQNFKNRESSWG